CARGAFAFW
nr:immunoglobulin heavy chain junction region [Mus musculus]